ncbi:MAG: hypothetical protein RIK87_16825 [Fuerstiella sp.]
MLKQLLRRFTGKSQQLRHRALDESLPEVLAEQQQDLAEKLRQNAPRILVVKQDVNEDLYCCPPEATAAELIRSTLLRTGPVALFTELNAEFRILQTTTDPECQVWQERATALHWDSLEFFASYRDRVPGRDYGQSRWAVSPESVDWRQYDIVVSMDVSVPARITQQYPQTLWGYYVREIKAPSYAASLNAAAPGQDVVFNHHFRLLPPPLPPHVLEFPYHLQRPGCFQKLFAADAGSAARSSGVFVDHHTMVQLSAAQRTALSAFGPVASTIHEGEREVIPTSERIARRTMDDDLRSQLLNSRFFLITPGQRRIFGTALVEAVAAGCLAIGSPASLGLHGFLFTPNTAATDADEAIAVMERLVTRDDLYHRELARQQRLVDYLCYVRPVQDLLTAWHNKTAAS